MKTNIGSKVIDTNHLRLDPVRHGYIVRDRGNLVEIGRLQANTLSGGYDYINTSGVAFTLSTRGLLDPDRPYPCSLNMDKGFADREYTVCLLNGDEIATLEPEFFGDKYRIEDKKDQLAHEPKPESESGFGAGTPSLGILGPIGIVFAGTALFGGFRDIGMYLESSLEPFSTEFWLITVPAIAGVLFTIFMSIVKREWKLPAIIPMMVCSCLVLLFSLFEPSQMNWIEKVLCMVLMPFIYLPAYAIIGGLATLIALPIQHAMRRK